MTVARGASEVATLTQPVVASRASRLRALAPLLAGGVVLVLCAALHLWRLGSAPGWDPQEGYNLDLAWNLAHGRLRLFSLTSAFAQHPPLYYLALALAIRLFGYSIVAVRALAAVYAVLTCAALLGVGRQLAGLGPALWGGVIFSAAPVLLANTRWGYSYAQLALVGLLCLWAAWRYSSVARAGADGMRWLLAASALAGLAAASDYVGVAWVLFVALVALRQSRRAALVAGGVGLGVLAVSLLAVLVAAPGLFLADLGTTLARAGGGSPLLQVLTLLLNYYRFLSLDPWLLLGVVGLFVLRDGRARGFLLGATALLALVALKVRPLGTSLHTVVPLLPLLALGAGIAFDTALRHLYAWLLGWLAEVGGAAGAPAWFTPRLRRLVAALVVAVAVVAPLGMALATDAVGLATTFPTRQDAVLATPTDAEATLRFVLVRARPGDLVLASPELAWRLDQPDAGAGQSGRLASADILQTVAQSGHAAAFYPAGLPPARWAYPVSLAHAQYVIVDNLVRALAAPNQEAALMPVLARVQQWPVAFQRGQYTIYERPPSP